MKIAVELVPRTSDAVREDLKIVEESCPRLDIVNVPDLLRYETRSWEACATVQSPFLRTIPHIRAIDLDLNQPLPMADYLRKHQIKEVLVVGGDIPQEMGHRIYPTTSTDIIRKFKQEMPEVKVYAAIDQYRTSIREEAMYIQRKLYAGADGFFTQPFFDVRFMEMYAELLKGHDVYWGVAPVMSERSVFYWEVKNNVVFPSKFEPTIEWNAQFAREALEIVDKLGSNIYFMPIRMNLARYFSAIFG
ncbi:MAG: methylenetetrahydrofolate reductase [Selenomonadales bacterium]|nr:methylenetetrahydrofolate reductase [Selenomonadales bacterium]